MIDIRKDQCVGCGACADACGVGCISMLGDAEGFAYPEIDKTKCVNCGACDKACPALNVGNEREKIPGTLLAVNRDEAVVGASSSGGVFSALADKVISEGGIVFGAAFDSDFGVHHIFAENSDELEKLRTSKYVQSNTGDIYSVVRRELKSGRKVLFSGTPCQVNAMRLFLGKEYENLLLVDFICHGVPSEKVWHKYLNAVSKGSKVSSVSFRDKQDGWKNYSVKIKSEAGEYKSLFSNDPYMRLFLSDNILRPSCYSCPAKGNNRLADITIADAWGMNENNPLDSNNRGLSLIFLRTPRGDAAINNISDTVKMCAADYNKAVANNPSAVKSVPVPPTRQKCMDAILSDENADFVKIAEKYAFHKSTAQKAKSLLKRAVRKIIK